MKHTSLFCSLIIAFIGFSYVEEEVELQAEGCTLKGTLTTQDAIATSTPLIILIAGSGPTDRDGNNPQAQNNSLKYVSDFLMEAGYSCLRYDKRAIAGSAIENFDQKELSFDQIISDASEWVNKYAADVRFHKIILAGHSQGSLVALCAANKNENVSGVISLAGAGEPIHKILKWQLSKTLKIEMQGLVDASLDTLAGGDTLKHVPDFLSSLFHPTIQPFLISWMKYDPAKEAAKLKVPMLIVNGTTDLQITKKDAELLSEANPSAQFKLIKNMNHVLKFTKSNDIGEQMEIYMDPEIPLHKKFAKVILNWIDEQEK